MSPAKAVPVKPPAAKKGRPPKDPNRITASDPKLSMVATRSSQRVKDKREGDRSRSTSVAPSASQSLVDHSPTRKRKRNATDEPADGVSTRSKRTKSSTSRLDGPTAAKDDQSSSEDRESTIKTAKAGGVSKGMSRGSSIVSTSGYSTRSRGKLPPAGSSGANSSFNGEHQSSPSYEVVANGGDDTPSPAKSNSSSSARAESPATDAASDALEVAINDPDLSASPSVNGEHQESASQEVVADDASPPPKKSNESSSITTPEIPATDLPSEAPDAVIDDVEGDPSEGEPAAISKRGRPPGFGRGRGRGRGGRGRGRGGRGAMTPTLSRQDSGTPAEKDPPKKRGYAGKRKTSENQLLQAAYDRQRDLRASFKSLAKVVRNGLTVLAERDVERLQEDAEYHATLSEHEVVIDGLQNKRTEVDAQRGRDYDRKSAFLQTEWALKDDYTLQQYRQNMEDIEERAIINFKAAILDVIRLHRQQIDDDNASIVGDESAQIRDMPDELETEGSAEAAENDAQLDPAPRGRGRRVNAAKSSPRKRLANETPADEPVAKRTNMLSAASAPADAPDDSDAADPSSQADGVAGVAIGETPDAQAAAIGQGDEYGVHIPGVHMPNRRRRGRAANEPNNRAAVKGWFEYDADEIGIRSTEREAQGFPPNQKMWYLDQGSSKFSELRSEDFEQKNIKTYKLHPRIGIPLTDSCNPDDIAPPTDFTLPTPRTNPIIFRYLNGKRFPTQPLGGEPPRNADKSIHTSRSWFMIDTEEAWKREVEQGWGVKVATRLLSDTLGLSRSEGIATFDATARLRADTVQAILDILEAASHADEIPSSPIKAGGRELKRSDLPKTVSSVAATLPQTRRNTDSGGLASSAELQRAQYEGAMGFHSTTYRGLPGPLEALADMAESVRQQQTSVSHGGNERSSTRRKSPAPRPSLFNIVTTQMSPQTAAPPQLPRVGPSLQSPTLVTPQSSRRSGPPFSPQTIAPQNMPRQIMTQSILQTPAQPPPSHQVFRRTGSLSSPNDLSRHSIMSLQPSFFYQNQSHTASQYYPAQQRVQQQQSLRGGRGQSANGLRDLLPDLRPRMQESPQIPPENQRYYDNAAQLPTYQHIQRAQTYQSQQQQPLLPQPHTQSPLQTQPPVQTLNPHQQGQSHHTQQQGQTHRPQQPVQTTQPQHSGQASQPQHAAQAKQPQHQGQANQPQHAVQANQPQHAAQTHQSQQPVQLHRPQLPVQTHYSQPGQSHRAKQPSQTQHAQQAQTQNVQQAQTHHPQQQVQTHQSQQPGQIHRSQQPAQTQQSPRLGQIQRPQQPAQTQQSPQLGQIHRTQQPMQTQQSPRLGQIHRPQQPQRSPQLGQMHRPQQPAQAQHSPPLGQMHRPQQPAQAQQSPPLGQMHRPQQPVQTQQSPQLGQIHRPQQPAQTQQPPQLGQMHRPQQPAQTQQPQQPGQLHRLQQPGQIHRPLPPGQSHLPMQPPQPEQSSQTSQPQQTPPAQPRQPMLFPPRPRPPPLFRPYFGNPRP